MTDAEKLPIIKMIICRYQKSPGAIPQSRTLFVTQETETFYKGVDPDKKGWRTFNKAKMVYDPLVYDLSFLSNPITAWDAMRMNNHPLL